MSALYGWTILLVVLVLIVNIDVLVSCGLILYGLIGSGVYINCPLYVNGWLIVLLIICKWSYLSGSYVVVSVLLYVVMSTNVNCASGNSVVVMIGPLYDVDWLSILVLILSAHDGSVWSYVLDAPDLIRVWLNNCSG